MPRGSSSKKPNGGSDLNKEVPMKQGKRNRDDAPEVDLAPAVVSTTKHFNSLIKAKHPSVSWVGNYTVTHTSKIEIGFLKREAMALTTLLSYYQESGQGATACPVSMVSGQASIGRKLAFFHSDPLSAFKTKINLAVGHRMHSKSWQELAQFARVDHFLCELKHELERRPQQRPKVIQGRLDLSSSRPNLSTLLRGKRGSATPTGLSDFLHEVFSDNQVDIVNAILSQMIIPDLDLGEGISLSIRKGYKTLFEVIVRFCGQGFMPMLTSERRVTLLTHGIERQDAELFRRVLEFIDPRPLWPTSRLDFVRTAVLQCRSGIVPFPGCPPKPPLGNCEIVRCLIHHKIPVNRLHQRSNQTPLQIAIGARNEEMVKLLVENYPADSPVNFEAECAREARGTYDYHVGPDALDWLAEIGIRAEK